MLTKNKITIFNHSYIKSIFPTIFLILILNISTCLAVNNATNPPTFSLKIKNEPLKIACRKIAAQTGYNIRILNEGMRYNTQWLYTPISTIIKNETPIAGLKKALLKFSYALTIDDKKQTIKIFLASLNTSDKPLSKAQLRHKFALNKSENKILAKAADLNAGIPEDDLSM